MSWRNINGRWVARRKIEAMGLKEITSGFDGALSWSITPPSASIDMATPVESDRRDADLRYALHQPDYFQNSSSLA